MSLRVGDRVARRSGGAGAWGEGFVTQVGSTSSRLCEPALLVTVSSTDPNAEGYAWDEVRPLRGGAQIIDEPEDVEAEMARLRQAIATLEQQGQPRSADGHTTPPGPAPEPESAGYTTLARGAAEARTFGSGPIDQSPSPPGGRGKLSATTGTARGGVGVRLDFSADTEIQRDGSSPPGGGGSPSPRPLHGEASHWKGQPPYHDRWDRRKQTVSNVLEVMHPDNAARSDPSTYPVDEHRYTDSPAVVGPLGAGPASPSPRLIVKPINTTYAVITVSVYSPDNPVFAGAKTGLPMAKEWEELSPYFRKKADMLGLTTQAEWTGAKTNGLKMPASGRPGVEPAANVLGFSEKSPYANDPRYPTDDQRFHWASIMNQKMAEVQVEGTFGWQHVIYNALEPELKAEFYDPTELSLIDPAKTRELVKFNQDVRSVLPMSF